MLAAMKSKGGCDVPLRQDPARARAADDDLLSPSRHKRPTIHLLPAVRRNRRASRRRAAELLKPEQLEALVAPIALYPDELLANVLAASTYPLEVVQADRWLKERKTLKGDALKTGGREAVLGRQRQGAREHRRTFISMMSDKIDWTKNLGDAVLAQQAGRDGRDPAPALQGL